MFEKTTFAERISRARGSPLSISQPPSWPPEQLHLDPKGIQSRAIAYANSGHQYTHSKDHAFFESFVHLRHPAFLLENIPLFKDGLLLVTELRGEGGARRYRGFVNLDLVLSFPLECRTA